MTESHAWIGKCRKCKVAKKVIISIDENFNAWQICGPECRTAVVYSKVLGKVNDTKCDSRCTNAFRADCECSCGGENHGDRWSAHAAGREQ